MYGEIIRVYIGSKHFIYTLYMFRIWGLNMLCLNAESWEGGWPNDVRRKGFPQTAITAVSIGGPTPASRLEPLLAVAGLRMHRG